jgi:polysaccharide biosynthesis transport protein
MRQIEPPRDTRFDVPALIPQGSPPQASHAPHSPMAAGKREYSGMLEYWNMIRRHPGAVILMAFTGGLLGFVMTLSQPRIYQAHGTIEIQSLNDNFLNMKELNPTVQDGGGFSSDSDIQTQVKILLSNSLIRRVTARMVEPPLSEQLPLPDRLSAWRNALHIASPTRKQLWRNALGTAAGGVRVRASGMTRIVDLNCDSTNPKLAADFVNTLADEYIEQNLETRWKSTEHTGEWLTNQLRDLRAKLEKSQDELQSYTNSTGLMVTSEKNNVNESRLADLQKELSSAQADRISKQSIWEIASGSPPDSLPAILDDAGLQGSQTALQDLKRNLAQLRVTFTPNHQEVKRVEAQIASLEAPLAKQRENILRRIRNEYDASLAREKLLTADYEAQAHTVSGETAQMDRYNFLKREVDATRALYESLVQKLKEASIASALRASNIRVVDRADIPIAPYKPDVPRSTTVGLLTGLCIGIAFAVFRERADRTLQDPGDAEYYLKIPELGVVPIGNLNPALARPVPRIAGAAPGEVPQSGMELMTWNSRTSLVAEAFRTTLTSILFSGGITQKSRVMVVTSASPKEGKTTVTCNLSIALAEVQSNVLLIDADMRRPRLHGIFQIENGPGLSDVLSDHEPLEWEHVRQYVQDSGIPSLKLMTSGKSRHKITTLLYSNRLPELMALLRTKFDTVIFDSPPMVNIADARMLGRHADGVVMVVRSHYTTRDAAGMAKQRLIEDGIKVEGVILNAWNPNVPGYSYYKNYYAGYKHYYGAESIDGSKPGKKKSVA